MNQAEDALAAASEAHEVRIGENRDDVCGFVRRVMGFVRKSPEPPTPWMDEVEMANGSLERC